jgi:hypothetical protein
LALRSGSPKNRIKNVDNFVYNQIKNYKYFMKEFPDFPAGWWIHRTIQVSRNSMHLISLEYTTNEYMGGAHGNEITLLYNFSPQTGHSIPLSSLLVKGKKDELLHIAEGAFRRLKNLKREESLDEGGFWFENDQFHLNNNYLIDRKGLVFYYNNYEIASYAHGPTRLLLDWKDIEYLIQDRYKHLFER